MTLYFLLFLGIIIISSFISYFLLKLRKKSAGHAHGHHRETEPNHLQKKYLELHRRMVSSLSNNYVNIEVIAEGGMGVIASAFDKERNRKVAIKTILPELQQDSQAVELFLHECQAIQAMNHPNVVRIFEVGQTEFLYFYVMDFLDGESLQDMIEKERILSVPQTVRISSQIARGLQHIHANGIIHRDIKPSNIFISSGGGVAKIIDFGVAKLLNAKNVSFSSSGGSPLYASPEQLRQEELTGKSDIYSLGVCMFYSLSGQHPFSETDLLSKMFEEPAYLKDVAPNVPEPLVRIVHLCLNLDPLERLPAHELWARLRAISLE